MAARRLYDRTGGRRRFKLPRIRLGERGFKLPALRLPSRESLPWSAWTPPCTARGRRRRRSGGGAAAERPTSSWRRPPPLPGASSPPVKTAASEAFLKEVPGTARLLAKLDACGPPAHMSETKICVFCCAANPIEAGALPRFDGPLARIGKPPASELSPATLLDGPARLIPPARGRAGVRAQRTQSGGDSVLLPSDRAASERAADHGRMPNRPGDSDEGDAHGRRSTSRRTLRADLEHGGLDCRTGSWGRGEIGQGPGRRGSRGAGRRGGAQTRGSRFPPEHGAGAWVGPAAPLPALAGPRPSRWAWDSGTGPT